MKIMSLNDFLINIQKIRKIVSHNCFKCKKNLCHTIIIVSIELLTSLHNYTITRQFIFYSLSLSITCTHTHACKHSYIDIFLPASWLSLAFCLEKLILICWNHLWNGDTDFTVFNWYTYVLSALSFNCWATSFHLFLVMFSILSTSAIIYAIPEDMKSFEWQINFVLNWWSIALFVFYTPSSYVQSAFLGLNYGA